jgi:hypothetical protein
VVGSRIVRALPWISFSLATIALVGAFVAQGLELAGSSHSDAGPVVTSIYSVAIALYGAGLIAWPLTPTFRDTVAAAYRNQYIGDPELPGWARRIAPAASVAFGIFLVAIAIAFWRSA